MKWKQNDQMYGFSNSNRNNNKTQETFPMALYKQAAWNHFQSQILWIKLNFHTIELCHSNMRPELEQKPTTIISCVWKKRREIKSKANNNNGNEYYGSSCSPINVFTECVVCILHFQYVCHSCLFSYLFILQSCWLKTKMKWSAQANR